MDAFQRFVYRAAAAILTLTLCFLTGCAEAPEIPTTTPIPETTAIQAPVETQFIREWGEDGYAVYCLYHRARINNARDPVTLRNTPAGVLTVRYDGNTFLAETSEGDLRYRHILYAPYQNERGRYECFLLSDREDMTYADCQTLSDGIVLFHQKLSYTPTAGYGSIPNMIKALDRQSPPFSSAVETSRFTFLETSYFITAQNADGSYTVSRYDYAGNPLSAIVTSYCGSKMVSYHPSAFLEFGNNNFALYTFNLDTDVYRLSAYDRNGQPLWTYDFKEGPLWLDLLLARDDTIYCFGTDKNSDLYFCALTETGAMLHNTVMGGSDLEMLFSVTPTANGFTVCGSTQSSDGAIPLSADGKPAYFEAQLSASFELLSIDPLGTWSGASHCGYYQGQPVYKGWGDAWESLPEAAKNAYYVFPLGGGHVSVHYRKLDTPPFSTQLVTDYAFSYYEPIYTGYDATGTALWQFTGNLQIH